MLVNNINQPTFVYENQASAQNNNHYLAINLKGANGNTQGIGAKISIYSKGKQQLLEQMPTRGFQSTVSSVLHFGLGKDKQIDSLRITWLRGGSQLLTNVKADKQLTLNENDATGISPAQKKVKPFFQEISAPFASRESKNTTNDFKRQPLLINSITFSGSCLAKGDINGDGLEDIYVGGQNENPGVLYLQQKGRKFLAKVNHVFDADKKSTDVAAVFFDANNDGKPDLYVASGGYADYKADDGLLQDRLYINDGKGNFTKATDALPKMISSKSCVKVADINGDGFADIFVGGRVIPGQYPKAPESYILINDGKGKFSNQTASYSPALKNIGMVTDAAWVDMNGDKKPDLIVAGDWMPITVFENINGKLIDASARYFDKKYTGWWNCINISDINHDGHPDIVAGNIGLNTQCKASDAEPAELQYKDFDDNGSIDQILCFYIQHKSYPFVTRDEMLDQMSMMRTRFPDYKSYADATIDKIFTAEELKGVKKLSANHLATTLFISNAQGKLRETSMPIQAQYAPVYTVNTIDYDHDGKTDLLLCGNINHARIRFGKYDANYGILLKGDGKGGYSYVNQQQSGFDLKGDVRGVLHLNDILLFSMDKGKVKAYKSK